MLAIRGSYRLRLRSTVAAANRFFSGGFWGVAGSGWDRELILELIYVMNDSACDLKSGFSLGGECRSA